jgi:hypothetical protein
MADIVLQRDVADLLTSKLGSAFAALTAGGSGDATAVVGVAIDRFATGSMPLSAELLLAFSAVLGATKSLSIGTVKIEQSPDGSNWDATALMTFTDPGIVASSVGGGTVTGVVKLNVPLGSAKRWVRVDFTPDLSAANTDTATVVAVWNLGGFDLIPAS